MCDLLGSYIQYNAGVGIGGVTTAEAVSTQTAFKGAAFSGQFPFGDRPPPPSDSLFHHQRPPQNPQVLHLQAQPPAPTPWKADIGYAKLTTADGVGMLVRPEGVACCEGRHAQVRLR